MYYFCINIPWENTDISAYENMKELVEENKRYMNEENDWWIIKGETLNETEIKTQLTYLKYGNTEEKS